MDYYWFFFAQTRMIWNILSAGIKNWHMGYNSYTVFITEYKFTTKIEKAKQIKDFEIPYYSINSIECSYADYLIWLTLNSDIPCFWKAHLALAWTSLLGIFFPEALHLVLHFHRSASKTPFISCNSQWLNCTL